MVHTFKFTSITCLNQQEENSGNDEIYFRLFDEGYGASAREMKSGVMEGLSPNPDAPYHTVHPGEEYYFTGTHVRVQIWEDDPGGDTAVQDELLQEFTVNTANEETTFWQRSDALYDVYHSVW